MTQPQGPAIALPAFDPHRCHFFALGRNAMYAACRLLGLRAGDEVLTPAFDCHATLQPFRTMGLRLRFYRSDPLSLAADVEDLRRRLTPQTKLVHVIHHFGFPQLWPQLRALRGETGIPILEDNAYTLLSRFDGQLVGTFGDVAIFSLHKTLQLLEGGMLRINRPDLRWAPPTRATRWVGRPGRRQVLSLLHWLGYGSLPLALREHLRRALGGKALPPPLYDDGRPDIPVDPERDTIDGSFGSDYLRPISRLALRQLEGFSAQDLRGMAACARERYVQVVEGARELPGVRVLWPTLPEGIVPFSVCLLLRSGRDRCLKALRERFRVMAWPTLSQDVIERLAEFPDVEQLGRQLLQIVLLPARVRQAGFRLELDTLLAQLRVLLGQYLGRVPAPREVLV